LTPDAGEKGELFGFDPLMPVKKGNFLALTPVTSILMADKSNFLNQFSNFQQLPRKKEGNMKKIYLWYPGFFNIFCHSSILVEPIKPGVPQMIFRYLSLQCHIIFIYL
jgi:hypothetical protein